MAMCPVVGSSQVNQVKVEVDMEMQAEVLWDGIVQT